MADLAWSRKYRPSSFDDYMGDNVKNLVMNRFKDRDNIPNTIMLYGTRGTGKTSMARLLAKEIHCMNPIDGHSCGECEMCQQIDEYITSTEAGTECYGITEVDAATTTGKSDINDIIDDALIAPMYPLKYKILILDECHMLSKAAQNSLLKVIEEPPAHLIFMLCTTDPDNIIPTIHSRMQLKIEVRKKTVDEIAERLKYIADKEGVKTTPEALKAIAKKGDRVPRECIMLLETLAKGNNYVVTVDTIRESTDEVPVEMYLNYFKSANTSLEDILAFNQMLKEKNIQAKAFMQGLTRFTLDCCYVKYGIASDDFPVEFVLNVKELFRLYTSSELDTLLQVVESAYRGIGDDEIRNELTITTTAMRIGKVGILAQGLNKENVEAEKENDASLAKYRERLAEDEAKQYQKIKEYGRTRDALNDVFKNMVEITGTTGVLENNIELSTSSNKSDDKPDNRFFSPEELD